MNTSPLSIGGDMLYWVIYDISDNNMRNKVASKCKDHGFRRVQKSSFLGNTTRNKIEMLALEVKEILSQNENKDCVFVFPSCKSCFSEKIIEGSLDEEGVRKKDYVFISD